MKTLLLQSAFTLLNTLAKQYSHIGLAINKKYENKYSLRSKILHFTVCTFVYDWCIIYYSLVWA